MDTSLRLRLAEAMVEARLPFDFARRFAAVVVDSSAGRQVVMKGASEEVLARCALDPAERAALLERAAAYEQGGQRVLAIATGAATPREVPDAAPLRADALGALAFAGVLPLRDPPKAGVRDALGALEALGVTIKLFSGDSEEVTRRIGHDVQCPVPESRIITGGELEAMDDAALADAVLRVGVFSRVTPEQKARLVAALRAHGRVVAFLGDGVNDAPALRSADVGIAVDTGADVAKDTADIVLLLTLFAVDMATFRTAWLVESACSEMLVTFAIRTGLPFWRSRPGTLLPGASALGVVVALLLPFVPAAQALFGFVSLPPRLVGYVALILVGYLATAELVKRWFFRGERVL
jgi:magnesium-transporting ATPase (P-type)